MTKFDYHQNPNDVKQIIGLFLVIGIFLIIKGTLSSNVPSIIWGSALIFIGTSFVNGLKRKQIIIDKNILEIPVNSLLFIKQKNLFVNLNEITSVSEKLSMEFIILELSGKKTYRINSWFLTEGDYQKLKSHIINEKVIFQPLQHDIKIERKRAFKFLSILMTIAVIIVAYAGKFPVNLKFITITLVLILLVNLLSYGLYKLMPKINTRRTE